MSYVIHEFVFATGRSLYCQAVCKSQGASLMSRTCSAIASTRASKSQAVEGFESAQKKGAWGSQGKDRRLPIWKPNYQASQKGTLSGQFKNSKLLMEPDIRAVQHSP